MIVKKTCTFVLIIREKIMEKAITEEEIRYYKQLDERQQRLFLGMKAKLLGRSGVRIVSESFKVNSKTVRKGKKELSELPEIPSKRMRKSGGGAKKNSTHILNGLKPSM